MARLSPLFSGSSGNSYYIGSRSAGLLIDAGRSARQIDGMLKVLGINPLAIQGILVTHEHSDHVSGLRVFAKKHSLPIFATGGTLSAIRGMVGDTARLCPVEPGETLELAGMEVSPFSVSHDCTDPVGYRIATADGRGFCLATDLGFVSDSVRERLLGCDLVVLESNHDEEMLKKGPYPYVLKRRILSDRGHLSNASCTRLLPQLAKSGVRRFLLAHLSRENNSPALAESTAVEGLTQAGYTRDLDYMLEIAPVENTEGRTIIF